LKEVKDTYIYRAFSKGGWGPFANFISLLGNLEVIKYEEAGVILGKAWSTSWPHESLMGV
jgi:hypothetical protein